MRNSIDRLFNSMSKAIYHLTENFPHEKPSPSIPPLDFTVNQRHRHRHPVIDAHLRRLMMMQQEEINSVGGQLVAGS